MKKLKILFSLVIILVSVPAFTQNLAPLGDDLSSFLYQFGKEMSSPLVLSSVSGLGMGEAELGGFPHFYFSTSGGAVLAHGIGTFIDENNTNFELLNVYGLVNQAIASSATAQDLYTKTRTFFPYPNIRLSIGLGTLYGVEVYFLFSMLPQAITDFGGSLAGLTSGSITANTLNIGTRIRKVLISDTGAFPAVSASLAYTYSALNLGYDIGNFSQDLSEFTLNIGGKLNMKNSINAFGLDVAISKKLLIFVPFARISAWYEMLNYSGSVSNFVAEVIDSGGTTITSYADQKLPDPSASYTVNDLFVVLTGGLELKLGFFSLTGSASFDPRNMLLGINAGMRAQF